MRNKLLVVALFNAFIFFSCSKKEKEETVQETTSKEITAPDFNSDSAYAYIQKQVDFGPRVPNTSAHNSCGNYLIEKLKSLQAEVSVQEFESKAFDGKNLKLRNIVGSFKPSNPKRIILAAHWDTRPFADKDSVNQKMPIDGANDGGSGVGVLLEIARILAANPTYNVGVDIIFFDGEDYGDTAANQNETWCLGSQYWAKNKHKANYSAYYGILLDMVGAKDAQFSKEEFSIRYARQIVNDVWEVGQKLGYGKFFLDFEDGSITDDHKFVNEIAKIPMIDIIELRPVEGFGDYHHTHKDNMNIIDKATLKAVGHTVLHKLYNEPGQQSI
jgi:glutaminyl-peptide cyclotransferase